MFVCYFLRQGDILSREDLVVMEYEMVEGSFASFFS